MAPDRIALTVSRPIARSGARSSIRGSLAVRAASASSPSSSPGAIAPPTNAPSARDRVEGRGRPEVDDHRRRSVQPRGGERVDEPVGADLARPVDPDRRSGRCPARPRAAAAPAARRAASSALGQRRDDRGAGDRRRPPRTPSPSSRSRSSSRTSSSSSVARSSVRGPPARRRAGRSGTSPIVTFVLPMSTARSMAG